MNKNVVHYRIRRLLAIIIGIVFLLAGLFKLLDPVGAGLVVEEYFRFLHLGFLMPAAKVTGVALALGESLIGAALISGIWRKPVAIIATVLIVFFTILTLFLAVFNPNMDCGCFGEVIHLTNLQTFLKNLILLALALAAFCPYSKFGENRKRKNVSFFIVAASIVAFMVYSLKTIPLVDYTAFTPGSELLSSKLDGNDSEEDGYTATFIYEKNGQEGAFTLDKLPDSTWTFVRTETMKINGPKVEENVPILSFTNASGEYADDMASKGNVLALSVYDVKALKGDAWTRLSEVVEGAKAAGFTPLLLSASGRDVLDSMAVIIPEVREKLLPVTYMADRKTLVSMNRSNGGATWFNDGQLIQKFSYGNLPSDDDILAMTGDDPNEIMLSSSSKGRLRFQGFILYALAFLLLL